MASGTIFRKQFLHFPHESGAAPTVIVSKVARVINTPSATIRSESTAKRVLHPQANTKFGAKRAE